MISERMRYRPAPTDQIVQLAGEAKVPFKKIGEKLPKGPKMLLAATGATLALAGGVTVYESSMSQPTPIVRSVENQQLTPDHQNNPDISGIKAWWDKLDDKERIAYGVMGLFSVLPLMAAAKGATTFVETKGNAATRWGKVVKNFYNDKLVYKTMVSALALETMLATEIFGKSGAEVGMSALLASEFVAILAPYAGIDKESEQAHAVNLKLVAPSLFIYPLAVFLGDQFPIQSLKKEEIQGYITPVMLVGAYHAYKYLKAFNDMAVGSRFFVQDIKVTELEAAVYFNRLLGELRINRSHNVARELITAVAQNNLSKIPKVLDKAFTVVEGDRAEQNAEAVVEMRGKDLYEGDERIRPWHRWFRRVKIGPAISLNHQLLEFSPSMSDYRMLVENEISERFVKQEEKDVAEVKAQNRKNLRRRKPAGEAELSGHH